MAVRRQPKKFIRKKVMDGTTPVEPTIEETPVQAGEQEVADVTESMEEKKNESGTPEEQPAEVVVEPSNVVEGFQEGDEVTITSAPVVALFGSDKGTFVEYLSGRVEAKILVNDEVKVIGVESIE